MEKVFTIYDLVCHLTALLLLCMAMYRSERIFIKARSRNVREILTTQIRRYERGIRIRMIDKFSICILFLCRSVAGIRQGYIFINLADLIAWALVSTLIVHIAFLDYRDSAPENED